MDWEFNTTLMKLVVDIAKLVLKLVFDAMKVLSIFFLAIDKNFFFNTTHDTFSRYFQF